MAHETDNGKIGSKAVVIEECVSEEVTGHYSSIVPFPSRFTVRLYNLAGSGTEEYEGRHNSSTVFLERLSDAACPCPALL